MKKSILALAALSMVSLSAFANVETISFDGEDDLYGLKRQTATNVADIEFVQEIKFSQSGIDVAITKDSETGSGFALVNTGGDNSGIFIYSALGAETSITPKIQLSVPGGKINGVKLFLSGSFNNAALNTLAIKFNGKDIESEKNNSLYFWSWTSDEGEETVSISWENKFYVRYIHSIEVNYTVDLQGKEACGLEFSEPSAEAVMGCEFTTPTLSNPYNLPLQWSSSDEKVATIDAEGAVTLVGPGKTTIIVSTEGNDQYAAGNALYDLIVIPSASNLLQMKESAPELYDRIMVNFPTTVCFANGSYAFVTDAEGNAGCFSNTKNQGNTSTITQTIYNIGDVIPAGWIATNASLFNTLIWEGIPPQVTDKVDVVYPEVTSVTPADVDRVVILKEVTFTKYTPGENNKVMGTTPDGTSYEFQNTYNTPEYPAGVYDVTCVVKYSKRGDTVYFFLAPVAFSEFNGIESINTANSAARYYNLLGKEVKNPDTGIYIKVINGNTEKVIIK